MTMADSSAWGRTLVAWLCGFIGVTAIPGAIGLWTGQLVPPLVLLQGSPFRSYYWPAAALAVIGLLAMTSAAAAFRRRSHWTVCASLTAGLLMAFELIQMLVIGSPSGSALAMQLCFLAAGGVIASLSVRHDVARRLGALAGVAVATALIVLIGLRPWFMHWGATAAERVMLLPGDHLVGEVITQSTRAITIDAPTAAVWPWLAQLGQDRGGFYSYDLLENIVGARMPTTDALHPAAQHWTPGDRLWMYPPTAAGGIGFAVLRIHQPGQALAFGTHTPGAPVAVEDGSWAFVLRSTDAGTTRFVVRGRAARRPTLVGHLFEQGVFQPLHFVMERRMMIGLKEVSERGARGRWLNHASIALWLIAFVIGARASVGVLRAARWHGAFAVVVASVAVIVGLMLMQPPVSAGTLLVAALAIAEWTRTSRRAGF